MGKTFIYALRCPVTNSIHYIGKTTKGMIRPRSHFTNSHSIKINEWVSDLKSLGHVPTISIMEEVKRDDLNERERYWINKCMKDGCDLLNEILMTPAAIRPDYDDIIGESQYDGYLEICKFIKVRRKLIGLNQEEFAHKIGIGLRLLRKIEQGREEIMLPRLLHILKMFGHTICVKKVMHE